MSRTEVPIDGTRTPDRQFVAAGLLLGAGLGGFVDGIVIHQILQWHHMLTDYGDAPPPAAQTVADLEHNTFWDGLFHATTWVVVALGLILLWRSTSAGGRIGGRRLVGLMLAGWGCFNLVEGVVNHHLLTIHHVRDDVQDPLVWDLGFLALGAALVLGGWWLARSDRAPTAHPGGPASRP